jgi:hypothetical protein
VSILLIWFLFQLAGSAHLFLFHSPVPKGLLRRQDRSSGIFFFFRNSSIWFFSPPRHHSYTLRIVYIVASSPFPSSSFPIQSPFSPLLVLSKVIVSVLRLSYIVGQPRSPTSYSKGVSRDLELADTKSDTPPSPLVPSARLEELVIRDNVLGLALLRPLLAVTTLVTLNINSFSRPSGPCIDRYRDTLRVVEASSRTLQAVSVFYGELTFDEHDE